MKKKFLKKLLIPLLSASILVLPSNSYAITTYNNQPEVIISSEAGEVPDYIVQQIVSENPEAGVINILDYGDIPTIDNEINENNQVRTPRTSYMVLIENVKTTKTVTNSNSLAKDEFKFSVAKGEEVTISFTYSGELKGSIKGKTLKQKEIGAEITIKGEYKKGTSYKGPAEGSQYNTREFRMKFYEELGTYTQTGDENTYWSGKIESTKKVSETGTYKKPTKYASYSIDKKI